MADPAAQTSAVDFAWRVHGLTQDWIRNVDQKAAIVLAIVVAVAGFAVTQVFDPDGSLHALDEPCRQWLVRAMGLALVVAAGAALYAVYPNLKRARTRDLSGEGLIFFGHLRGRPAAELEKDFGKLDEAGILKQLALQIEATTDVAWKKHARLQVSQIALAVAVLTFLAAELA